MGRAPHWQAAQERPVVVLGAGGMLASALVWSLEEHEVHYVALSEHDLDITLEGRVNVLLRGLSPRVVINAAAYTDVDGAEKEKEKAFAVNGEAPGHLARFCGKADAKLVHISTDYVFGGTKASPYLPDDETDPVNVYGASKLEGERQVQKNTKEHLIVRTSWLYGLQGRNFVTTMLELGRTRSSLDVVNDQVGSPTYTRHLATGILRLMNHGVKGIYHVTNAGHCTWYDFALEIFKMTGISVTVQPVPTEEFPRPAPRPRSSVLDCSATYRLLGSPLPQWPEALEEYLRDAGWGQKPS